MKLATAALAGLLAMAMPHVASADLGPPTAKRRVVVTETSYEVIEPLRFTGATAELAPESGRMLDSIAKVLDANPELRLVEIRAFGAGPAKERQAVADARARAIADQLVRRGVAPARLRIRGVARPPKGSSADPQFVIVRRGS